MPLPPQTNSGLPLLRAMVIIVAEMEGHEPIRQGSERERNRTVDGLRKYYSYCQNLEVTPDKQWRRTAVWPL